MGKQRKEKKLGGQTKNLDHFMGGHLARSLAQIVHCLWGQSGELSQVSLVVGAFGQLDLRTRLAPVGRPHLWGLHLDSPKLVSAHLCCPVCRSASQCSCPSRQSRTSAVFACCCCCCCYVV